MELWNRVVSVRKLYTISQEQARGPTAKADGDLLLLFQSFLSSLQLYDKYIWVRFEAFQ